MTPSDFWHPTSLPAGAAAGQQSCRSASATRPSPPRGWGRTRSAAAARPAARPRTLGAAGAPDAMASANSSEVIARHVTWRSLAGLASLPPDRIRARDVVRQRRGQDAAIHIGGGHPVSSALGDPTDRACWPLYGLEGPAPMLVIGQGGLAPWAVVERDGVSVSRCACWMSRPRRSMACW
jgi:hypothetical protein